MEPPADSSWVTLEPVGGYSRWRRWTVEGHSSTGQRDPFAPRFLSRRRAERYARRHNCEHLTYTVVPVAEHCGGCHMDPKPGGPGFGALPPPIPVNEPITANNPPKDYDG
jgi:hypothetical protein